MGLVRELSQVEWLVNHCSGAEPKPSILGTPVLVEGRDSPVGTSDSCAAHLQRRGGRDRGTTETAPKGNEATTELSWIRRE